MHFSLIPNVLRCLFSVLKMSLSSNLIVMFTSYFFQYFNNEKYEAEKYGKYLTRYQEASLKTTTSLAFLNFGQNLIFSSALTVMMLLASQKIMQGINTRQFYEVFLCNLHLILIQSFLFFKDCYKLFFVVLDLTRYHTNYNYNFPFL